MKILITVDPEIPVPPKLYGGIERIADSLASEYKAAEHEVILLAHPASSCKAAKTKYGWKGAKSQDKRDILTNAIQLFQVYQKEKPDIIHSFSRLLYLYPLFLFSKALFVQSYQRAISAKSTSIAKSLAGPRLRLTACGAHLFQQLPQVAHWTAIHNFTDTDFLTPNSNQSKEYLLFLGRIEPIKGTKEAIEAAKATGEKLLIAGNIPEAYQSYFDQEVKPWLSDQIQYVGPVNDVQKRELFQGAKAFLFPIQWEEPFGIVMAESLACGVPIIAFDRGSVPEVVIHGKNGFICKSLQEMVNAIDKIETIAPSSCRKYAETNFSSHSIAKKYLLLFEDLLNA
ncbi:MAG: glycosyltransferase [Saprospiraceae bacterium]